MQKLLLRETWISAGHSVSKEAPVGFRKIRLRFDLDCDASEEQPAVLVRLTERYCGVFQTFRNSPEMSIAYGISPSA
jgi:uncharacterized OsmC-like protein